VVIGSTGVINANALICTASNTAGNSITINSGGILNFTGNTVDVWGSYSTTNNFYTFSPGSIVEYSYAGSQTIKQPASYSNLILSGSGTKTLGENVAVNNNLTINSGSVMTVPSTMALTVSGTTNLNGAGCLILHSDASGTASFIDNGITGTGSATMERYLTTDIHHFISAPISNATANDLRTSDPTATHGWAPWIVDPATPLQVMRGYDCWKPASNPALETFTGALNTGNQTFTGNRNGSDPYAGWHLVGNPYPSAIDLTTGITWDKFEPTAYFWDQAGSYPVPYPSGGNYDVYPAYGAFGTHSQYAPPEQGFYVHIVNTWTGSSVLTFTNAARVHNGVTFLKDQRTITNGLMITASSVINTYSDKITVQFKPETTADYDPGYDAYKLGGLKEAPQLYTMIGETKISCNSMPFSEKNMVIPVYFSCGLSGQYTLTADSLGTFQSNAGISLQDLKLNTTQDLRLNRVYSFSYDTLDSPGRFLLHVYNPSFGVDDVKKDNRIQIYSFGSSVYIRSTDGSALSGDIFIYDVIGRELYQGQLVSNMLDRITPGIHEGYYAVRVVSRDGVYSGKVYLGN
jgi:hypothetical protein